MRNLLHKILQVLSSSSLRITAGISQTLGLKKTAPPGAAGRPHHQNFGGAQALNRGVYWLGAERLSHGQKSQQTLRQIFQNDKVKKEKG